MKSEFEEMVEQNERFKQETEDAKKSTAEIYAQNNKMAAEGEQVQQQMKEGAAELANYKELMEQALVIRKNLEGNREQ